jgi:arsenite methyltransferase
MAELSTDPAAPMPPTPSCCPPEAQATCCEPSAKGAAQELRETVRERYAKAARGVVAGAPSSCGDTVSTTDEAGNEAFGARLYDDAQAEGATASAVAASLGCGVPTAVADLHEGETVLDLGSGAGADVLISARRVGATGRAIGLDMTDEMLELARANAAEAGVENVEFIKGYIEDIPLPDGSVDVIVSNCVVNLSGDKAKVLAEAARVLRPGGRFAVSDVIASPDMDEATRADMAAFTGCIAGALTEEEFRSGLEAAGFTDIEIRPTHRVHEHAAAAIIRARQPDAAATTRRVELYEPAMCCQTGVCGPSVDQQLIDVREDLRWAETQGALVARHNLSSDPDAFVANPKVTGLMAAFGEDALPVLVVDGDIAIHGRYPSRQELAGVLAAPAPPAVERSPSPGGGCGCGPGGC